MTNEAQVDLPFDWPRDEIRAFCRKWQIIELAIFGSALRPDFGTDSDIDLLARFAPNTERSVFDQVRMEDELGQILRRPVDLVTRLAVEESPNPKRRQARLRRLTAAEVPGIDLRQTFGHIRRINTILGVYVPALVTPLELIGEQQ